jgi:hypothetical protein
VSGGAGRFKLITTIFLLFVELQVIIKYCTIVAGVENPHKFWMWRQPRNVGQTNKCSIEMFIKLALTLFFKRQQHRKLSWLDKDSDKDQSQFDELFN